MTVEQIIEEKNPYICVCCSAENTEYNEMHERGKYQRFSDCFRKCEKFDIIPFGYNNLFIYCYL